MRDLYETLTVLTLLVFGGLSIAAFAQWRKHRGEAAAWLAATFGVLGLVVVVARFLPEHSDSAVVTWIRKLEVAVLVLFPYFLYRFTTSFFRPRRWPWIVAHVLTAAAFIGAFLVELPEEGEPRSTAVQIYVYLILVQWVFLSLRVTLLLWRQGRGQPRTTRLRLRALSLGSLGLALAIVLAGSGPGTDEVTGIQIATQLLALVSGPLFLLGFAPPRLVRALWRRPEESRFRQAQLELMEATTSDDVASTVLPHASELGGGRTALLVDEGRVIGSLGLSDDEREELAQDLTPPALQPGFGREVISVPLRKGWLAVEAGPYSPFFGQEEAEMLRSLAAIADLALARTKLLRSERGQREQLLEAQRLAHIGSWQWSVVDDRVTWSDELHRIYGLPPEKFEGTQKAFLELVHPDDRRRVQRITERALEKKEAFGLEHRIVRPDGSVATVHARGRVLVDESGNPIGMIGTVQDITERKRHERFREQFIANAAHELRTPLSSLLGFIDLLSRHRSRLTEAQLAEIFGSLSEAGTRMSSLVRNLLDLTKLQRGETRLETQPVKVSSLSREVLEAVPPPDGTRVEVDVSDDLLVDGDSHRLHQVLSNLLTNAYRYGGPDVLVNAYETDGEVVLSISDNGPGVEESVRPHLFEPFMGGPGSTSVGGSGLGLSIVKMLVEAHRGQVWYEPGMPSGARFCVRLPGRR